MLAKSSLYQTLLPVYLQHLSTLLPDTGFLGLKAKSSHIFFIYSADFTVDTLFVPQARSLGEQGPDGLGARQFPSTGHSAYRQVHFTSRNH